MKKYENKKNDVYVIINDQKPLKVSLITQYEDLLICSIKMPHTGKKIIFRIYLGKMRIKIFQIINWKEIGRKKNNRKK